ncbi:MAG: hypothetical protein N4A41_08035 [Crocinitomicaceae bacterium]|nr:hypothetical protein [Crocinitomicaceae bacterium]
MARQTGIIKLKGRIGDLSFYKTKDGHLAREKGGVDGQRIANDPAFARTRENGSEFGIAAKAGKLLRDAVRTLMMKASDGRVTARLTQVMSKIRMYDTTNDRGKRTVAVGIVDPAGKALLNNFNFNIRSILGSVLFKPFTLDPATGQIQINGLIPGNDIAYPAGATHISIKGAWVKVDFDQNIKAFEETNQVNLAIDFNSTNVDLNVAQAPTGPGTDVFLLLLEFFQEINGTQYPLKNGQYNSLSVIGIG